MIKIGDRVPDATLYESVEFGEACPLSPKPISVAEAMQGKEKGVKPRAGAERVAKALNAYGEHFDHAGWKRI